MNPSIPKSKGKGKTKMIVMDEDEAIVEDNDDPSGGTNEEVDDLLMEAAMWVAVSFYLFCFFGHETDGMLSQ